MTETPEALVRCYAESSAGVRVIDADAAIGHITESIQKSTRADHSGLVWIDITRPGAAEARLLRERLGLHPLAVEDSLRGRQRPKVEHYPGYYFVVFYAASINKSRDRVALSEFHTFLGNNFLITVHDHELPEVDEVVTAWTANPSRAGDAGGLAHALLDAIVDDYFPVVEHFANRLDQLEDRVFSDEREEFGIFPAFKLRHEMILLRRILSPEREVLSSLLRHDLPFVRPEFVPYFQDVYDHLLRVTEEIDAFRDLLTGLIEVHSSNTAKRLNATMQTLTAWSIILMSVTVVAGIYGMNFVVMPELGLSWGYYGALTLMLVVGGSLAIFFRRRRWL